MNDSTMRFYFVDNSFLSTGNIVPISSSSVVDQDVSHEFDKSYIQVLAGNYPLMSSSNPFGYIEVPIISY